MARRPSVSRLLGGGFPTSPKDNPRPWTWDKLGPSKPYPCMPWEAGYEGTEVKGRAGGTILSCATPSTTNRAVPRGREGQFWMGRGGKEFAKRKSTVRNALRRERAEIVPGTPVEVIRQLAEHYKARPGYPLPIGVPYPHVKGSSKCAPDHKIWGPYAAASKRAEEAGRKALEEVGFLDDSEVEEIKEKALRKSKHYRTWQEVTLDCVRGFEYVEANRKPKAGDSATRQAATARREMLNRGVDPGSPEYLDTLSPSGRAKALRRLGRVSEARDLERHQRELRKRRR